MKPETAHVITYAFETLPTLEGQKAGGLPSVIAAELNGRTDKPQQEQLIVISNDKHPMTLPRMTAEVQVPTLEGEPNFDRFTVWFEYDWIAIHNDAYKAPNQTPEALNQMFQGEYQHDAGSIERVLEHHERYAWRNTSPDAAKRFNDRFAQVIQAIPDGSTLNWQDYFFLEAMNEHGDALRDRGIFQTFHLHTTVPEQLYLFPRGAMLLEAISKMDRAYVHTDEYARRLAQQLQILNLQIPEIRRFDLGVDQDGILKDLNATNKNNYQEHPEYKTLTPDRKMLVDEVFATQDVIPHRFVTIDRPEPGKGTEVLLRATDEYLSSLGENPDEMRSKYRFFFVMPDIEIGLANPDPYNTRYQYTKYVSELATQLVRKYPGIIFTSGNVPRPLIPSMLKGAHVMTGGIQDGLNLAAQEGAFINAAMQQDVTAIIGQGAGFAMQTIQSGGETYAAFPHQGNIEETTACIRTIVRERENHPGTLKNKTQGLVDLFIAPRRDSVIVGR